MTLPGTRKVNKLMGYSIGQAKKGERPRRYWNYRVMEFRANGYRLIGFREVHYENGRPVSYADGALEWDEWGTLADLRWKVDKMKEALDKPILKPKDFKPKGLTRAAASEE